MQEWDRRARRKDGGTGGRRRYCRSEPRRLLRALLVTARSRQCAKNVLVFGAPVTGGVLLKPAASARTVLALVALCLVASGMDAALLRSKATAVRP